jgi:hypothetical protein
MIQKAERAFKVSPPEIERSKIKTSRYITKFAVLRILAVDRPYLFLFIHRPGSLLALWEGASAAKQDHERWPMRHGPVRFSGCAKRVGGTAPQEQRAGPAGIEKMRPHLRKMRSISIT